MFFLNYQMLLGKEIYPKTVYEHTSDSTIQEKTSVYVLTLHTRHATYLQLIGTLFPHFISLTTFFSKKYHWNVFPLYENKHTTYK